MEYEIWCILIGEILTCYKILEETGKTEELKSHLNKIHEIVSDDIIIK